MHKVFVVGGDTTVITMFQEEGWGIVNSIDWAVANPSEIDLVQFCGGEDVSPDFYGEKPTAYCSHFNPARDRRELGIYTWALAKEIPMAGICRGGQFLNVMNGGSLWQHANSHAISGTHQLFDYVWNKEIAVTSTHHQIMRPNPKAEDCLILADCSRSCLRIAEKTIERTMAPKTDTEVVFYARSNSLCFQPHPEYVNKDHECRRYYFDLLAEFLYLEVKEDASNHSEVASS